MKRGSAGVRSAGGGQQGTEMAMPNTPPTTRAVRLVDDAMPAQWLGTAPSTAAAIGVEVRP